MATTHARKTSSTTKARAKATPSHDGAGLLGFDVKSLLDKAKLPGIDINGLIDARRRDIDALLEANTQAYRGLEALNRRQAEILAETMKQMQAGAEEFMAEEGNAGKASKAAELAQRAFGQSLANLKEIAQAAVKSQEESLKVLKKRHDEHMAELQKQFKLKD